MWHAIVNRWTELTDYDRVALGLVLSTGIGFGVALVTWTTRRDRS